MGWANVGLFGVATLLTLFDCCTVRKRRLCAQLGLGCACCACFCHVGAPCSPSSTAARCAKGGCKLSWVGCTRAGLGDACRSCLRHPAPPLELLFGQLEMLVAPACRRCCCCCAVLCISLRLWSNIDPPRRAPPMSTSLTGTQEPAARGAGLPPRRACGLGEHSLDG